MIAETGFLVKLRGDASFRKLPLAPSAQKLALLGKSLAGYIAAAKQSHDWGKLVRLGLALERGEWSRDAAHAAYAATGAHGLSSAVASLLSHPDHRWRLATAPAGLDESERLTIRCCEAYATAAQFHPTKSFLFQPPEFPRIAKELINGIVASHELRDLLLEARFQIALGVAFSKLNASEPCRSYRRSSAVHLQKAAELAAASPCGSEVAGPVQAEACRRLSGILEHFGDKRSAYRWAERALAALEPALREEFFVHSEDYFSVLVDLVNLGDGLAEPADAVAAIERARVAVEQSAAGVPAPGSAIAPYWHQVMGIGAKWLLLVGFTERAEQWCADWLRHFETSIEAQSRFPKSFATAAESYGRLSFLCGWFEKSLAANGTAESAFDRLVEDGRSEAHPIPAIVNEPEWLSDLRRLQAKVRYGDSLINLGRWEEAQERLAAAFHQSASYGMRGWGTFASEGVGTLLLQASVAMRFAKDRERRGIGDPADIELVQSLLDRSQHCIGELGLQGFEETHSYASDFAVLAAEWYGGRGLPELGADWLLRGEHQRWDEDRVNPADALVTRARWLTASADTDRQLDQRGSERRRLDELRRILHAATRRRGQETTAELAAQAWRSARWRWETLPHSRWSLARARREIGAARLAIERQLLHYAHPASRRHARQTSKHIYELQVELWLANQRPSSRAIGTAFEASEAYRARVLDELLGDDFEATPRAPSEILDFYRKSRRARQSAMIGVEISSRELTELRRTGQDPSQTEAVYDAAARRYDQAVGEEAAATKVVRRLDPSFDGNRPIRPVSAAEVQRLLGEGEAAIQYTLTGSCGFACILSRRWRRAVRLPLAGAKEVRDLALRLNEATESREKTARIERERILSAIGVRLLDPVIDALPPRTSHLVIAPHRASHLLPLHAAKLASGDDLIDRYTVSIAPSFSVLARVASRGQQAGDEAVLIDIDEGLYERSVYRSAEIERVATELHNYQVRRVRTGPGVVDEVIAALAAATQAHFAGHAEFLPKEQLASHLWLGPRTEVDRRLTIDDVYRRVDSPLTRLVFLNACKTGKLSHDPLDDYVSFASAFLYAGARNVVTTLWSVDDLAALLFAERFYQEWRHGRPAATALRKAMLWLRGSAGPESLRDWDAVRNHLQTSPLREAIGDEFDLEDALEGAMERADGSTGFPFSDPIDWAPYTVSGVTSGY